MSLDTAPPVLHRSGNRAQGAAVLLIFVGVFGLIVGALLGAAVDRVPAWSTPRADAPVRSALLTPAVALATAALFVGFTLRLALPELPAYLYFVAIGVALSAIDVGCRRLPNVIVLPSYPVLAALLAASAWWQGDFWPLVRAGIGGLLLLVFFCVLAVAHPTGMGFGDVKLAGLVGMVLGYLSWRALLIGGFAGFLLAGLVGVVIIVSRRGDRRTALPFGPFLVAGALLAMFTADALAG